ncbi:xanthine dehydrogenase YagT iron-sulfur-binding subunit [Rhodococcus pyridinivorans]|uniref:2Fe-2S iron-sulfur cluster-binding protein n=1 Tax=Rhodococcus pyridinivorans TaxID=103816 RepID=UPI0007CD5289|nr:2Fe-2S iron-sulfur cluster-binding protein [Rhodococcus pyridinivorans]QXF83471.1 2Fe-2S iron-sulfur cluster binding domain-containing protein [Rhodococcus pyridinivorans]SEC66349.1 xanthine dehydrogenase YagT iron-sulfur-binding subunit [Rhodococcus pyridinivorans]
MTSGNTRTDTGHRPDLDIVLHVDGVERRVPIDVRTTVLDALRDRLGITSPKKGCDLGQCGACTVLIDGRRTLSCLALAASHDGAEIVTAAGLGDGEMHPLQAQFIEDDAFQCGYCTPGQICSAVGMLDEFADGAPSHVTADLEQAPELDDDEIRERMSGNLCRCAAYPNIVSAIRTVAAGDSRIGVGDSRLDTEETR